MTPADIQYHSHVLWHDSRTWGPPGLGCRLCHDNPSYRMAICLSCLVRCLGWNVGIVVKWVERQDASYVRQEAQKEALRLWGGTARPRRYHSVCRGVRGVARGQSHYPSGGPNMTSTTQQLIARSMSEAMLQRLVLEATGDA